MLRWSHMCTTTRPEEVVVALIGLATGSRCVDLEKRDKGFACFVSVYSSTALALARRVEGHWTLGHWNSP